MAKTTANAEPEQGSSDAAYTEFLQSFRSIEIPFCPFGMRLLYRIAQERPDLYELVRQYGFATFDEPAFQSEPYAQTLAHHVGSCALCQAC